MALSQRLELRQGQSLVMTPQLQQAIKLLQLSNLELAEYVEGELERNPLLERDDARSRARPRATRPKRATRSRDARADEALAREDFSTAADMDAAAHDDMYDGESRTREAEAAATPGSRR